MFPQSVKTHSLFEAEDKGAEEFLMGARKHLFLANNLYFVLSFARDKKSELLAAQSSAGALAAKVSDQLRK